ncbi:MAG: CPBP family intramembrane metalloprotease [Anaerolineales bacterium]
MSRRKIIAIISPLILMGMMYPIFGWLTGALGKTIGWYLGLVVYWLLWGAVFPLLIIGKESIRNLIRPRKPDAKAIGLVLLMLLLAGTFRLITKTEYQKPSIWIFVLLLTTNPGNGFFEEVLWRGVYMKLFPDNLFFRIVWPSFWFALWHYIPVTAHSDKNPIGMIIGPGLMGLYLGFLAKKTGTIWWTILAHTIGGFIMIL